MKTVARSGQGRDVIGETHRRHDLLQPIIRPRHQLGRVQCARDIRGDRPGWGMKRHSPQLPLKISEHRSHQWRVKRV